MARDRRSRYQQIARQTARKHGIPVKVFFSMIEHESGWNPTAVSYAGALGLGQLMPGTARGLGVDPLNPKQNLEGAARYLKGQHGRFGNWKDALRAYNQGPNAISDPSAGLEYANSVLGSSQNSQIHSRSEKGISVKAPMGTVTSAPKFDMTALAQALFADDPEFLPLAQSVANLGPTNPVLPDEVQPKTTGRPTSFNGKMLSLGTSWKGTHTTDGDLRYGDWPKMSAADIMASPGTPVGAPEDGEIIDWGSAQGGEALYFKAKSGWLYWLGHIDDRLAVGTKVKRGQPLATVSADHPAPHVHVDRKKYR